MKAAGFHRFMLSYALSNGGGLMLIQATVTLILCLRHYPIEKYYPQIQEMKTALRNG